MLQEAYFSGVGGILAVCDVTRPETLIGLKQWMEVVERVAGKVPMVMLVNKAALAGQAKLTKEELEGAAKEFQCQYFLTSARTAQNVESAIKALMVSVVKRAEPWPWFRGGVAAFSIPTR